MSWDWWVGINHTHILIVYWCRLCITTERREPSCWKIWLPAGTKKHRPLCFSRTYFCYGERMTTSSPWKAPRCWRSRYLREIRYRNFTIEFSIVKADGYLCACVQGAGREGDAAKHKQSGASSPLGEAMRLQPLSQGVPGSRNAFSHVILAWIIRIWLASCCLLWLGD